MSNILPALLLPDIRNEPEPDSHPYNEVGIDIEIESVSDSAIEREEEIAVGHSAKARSQGGFEK